MMRKFLLLSSSIMLSGCLLSTANYDAPEPPAQWNLETARQVEVVQSDSLKGWWNKFHDPVLNVLIKAAMKTSPDRLIAEARIAEVRGARRTSRSFLFPQIGVSGSGGREDTGLYDNLYPDNFYDAGFDASYEVDIFGRNRKNLSAADQQLLSVEAEYQNVSLSLVSEIARDYVQYRAAQNQVRIAKKNLVSQEETLKLVEDLHRLGSAPKLDVERTSNLVNTTRASIPEFERQADGARLRLGVLVGVLPDQLDTLLAQSARIPGMDVRPVLMAPADVLANRPDVKAASYILAANSDLTASAITDIFPTFSLSGFYGVADNAVASAISPWNVALGAAVSLIDFGRIEGRIDAAKARERQAYEQYRKTILTAVSEVETALSDYAHINQRYLSLQKAYGSAYQALQLSQTLYREGEIAFLDVLDSQRTVNNAEASLLEAEAAKASSLIRLYKSLGVY